MPISHKYKTLFIHIPKNAGKSFEIFLGIHNQYEGAPNSRSFANKVAKYFLNKTTNVNAVKQLIGTGDKSFATQHLTLQEILLANWVDNQTLKQYRRVAIIRDPFDRAFSLYNHHRLVHTPETIESIEDGFFAFLNQIEGLRNSSDHAIISHFRQQVDYLRDLKGNIDSVAVLRLENLKEDVNSFCERKSLDALKNKSLPISKESKNDFRDKAKSQRNIDLVYNLFKDDFESLGYEKTVLNNTTF